MAKISVRFRVCANHGKTFLPTLTLTAAHAYVDHLQISHLK
jgi:hypothetical protein